MRAQSELNSKTTQVIGGVLLSFLLGITGGGICGAAILFFNAFIGRSETTGEYFGYWNLWNIPIGLFCGAPIGALAGPLAYPFLIRKIGFQKALLPAFAGTLMGGFAGAVVGPVFAVISGIFGFFLALVWARVKVSNTSVPG
jgi:hypothetical protein